VSSPGAVADCAARATPRDGAIVLDPTHAYTLGELIEIAEHHNPSTRIMGERAKQRARELGLAKSHLHKRWRSRRCSSCAFQDRLFRSDRLTL